MWWRNTASLNFALIVADGDAPSLALLKHYSARASNFIALDGAATWLLEQNLRPHIVIGDLDSFEKARWPEIPTQYVDDQNTNDLEKALAYCQKHNLHRVVILGAFGQRIDHFLTNLFAVRKYAYDLDLALLDDEQMAFILRPGEKLELLDMRGAYCSLFPFGPNIGPITTSGLQYPLQRELLCLDKRIGTLNRIVEDKALIVSEQGDLLIVLPLSLFPQPLRLIPQGKL